MEEREWKKKKNWGKGLLRKKERMSKQWKSTLETRSESEWKAVEKKPTKNVVVERKMLNLQ